MLVDAHAPQANGAAVTVAVEVREQADLALRNPAQLGDPGRRVVREQSHEFVVARIPRLVLKRVAFGLLAVAPVSDSLEILDPALEHDVFADEGAIDMTAIYQKVQDPVGQ